MTAILALGSIGALSLSGFRKKPVLIAILCLLSLALFLSVSSSSFLLCSTLILSLILGLPLFVCIGLMVLILFTQFTSGFETAASMTFLIRKIQEIGNKEVLLAIPFFVFAGDIMSEGRLAHQLIDVAKACFGWIPGGLAVAAISGCIFFAAISGSSPVTVIAIGSLMVPALIEAGYKENFSIGLLTSAGSLGILIPPSVPMIIYALMVGSVTPIDPMNMFIAGVVPGLLLGGLLSVYAIITGLIHKYPRDTFSVKKIALAFRDGIWSLLLPVIILGGIYSGIFTPTEGAAVSVMYAVVVEVFIQKNISLKQLAAVGERSMVMMGTLFVIMSLALGLNHFLVLEQIPDQIVDWLESLNMTTVGFLLALNVFLLLVGTLMDIVSAILVLAPMLAPMGLAMGIDPIHMGIIFIVNLEIGYLTPPVGLNLFVASTLFKKGLGQVIHAVLPTLLIMLLGLLLVTWVPKISLGLVEATTGYVPLNKEDESAPGGKAKKGKTLLELMQEAQNP